jgi:hypothetical protein
MQMRRLAAALAEIAGDPGTAIRTRDGGMVQVVVHGALFTAMCGKDEENTMATI